MDERTQLCRQFFGESVYTYTSTHLFGFFLTSLITFLTYPTLSLHAHDAHHSPPAPIHVPTCTTNSGHAHARTGAPNARTRTIFLWGPFTHLLLLTDHNRTSQRKDNNDTKTERVNIVCCTSPACSSSRCNFLSPLFFCHSFFSFLPLTPPFPPSSLSFRPLSFSPILHYHLFFSFAT